MNYRTFIPLKSSENHRFTEGIEVNSFTQISLTIEAKFGSDFLLA